jgi:hypothetical protein
MAQVRRGEGIVSFFTHEFETAVVRHDVGKYAYTVVFLAPELAADLPFNDHPKLRFEGEINDHPLAAAWQPVQGRHFAMLSKSLLKDTGIAIGDRVSVRFRVADQDAVNLPSEIESELGSNSGFNGLWQAMSSGRKRAFCHFVGDAKSADVRARRMATLLAALADNPDVNPMFVGRHHRKAASLAQ